MLIAERIDAFLGTRFFFVAAGTTEGGVELVLVEGLFERLGLHDVGVDLAAVRERSHALLHAFLVDVDDQIPAELLADELFAEGDHLAELPGRVDVHQRKRRLGRIERLLGKPHHDRRVLADRVEHDRVFELGGHLADDVDALGFELFEVGQVVRRHSGCTNPKEGRLLNLPQDAAQADYMPKLA